MITKETWSKGLKSGVHTTWVLGKVVFPITMIVSILNYTPVIHWVTSFFTPLMKWIGLPGEAAIPLALGYLLNLYAAIGAILSLDLTVKNVFILAIMLSFAHNLLVETVVAKKLVLRRSFQFPYVLDYHLLLEFLFTFSGVEEIIRPIMEWLRPFKNNLKLGLVSAY